MALFKLKTISFLRLCLAEYPIVISCVCQLAFFSFYIFYSAKGSWIETLELRNLSLLFYQLLYLRRLSNYLPNLVTILSPNLALIISTNSAQ